MWKIVSGTGVRNVISRSWPERLSGVDSRLCQLASERKSHPIDVSTQLQVCAGIFLCRLLVGMSEDGTSVTASRNGKTAGERLKLRNVVKISG
jgi:hypothetical protein